MIPAFSAVTTPGGGDARLTLADVRNQLAETISAAGLGAAAVVLTWMLGGGPGLRWLISLGLHAVLGPWLTALLVLISPF